VQAQGTRLENHTLIPAMIGNSNQRRVLNELAS